MYQVVVLRQARKVIRSLADKDAARVEAAIDALATNPRPPGYIKLTNSDDWRIRVGDYRVLYTIEDDRLLVSVVRVQHRRDVYR
jgi:mRNA interferase RelE/StbE